MSNFGVRVVLIFFVAGSLFAALAAAQKPAAKPEEDAKAEPATKAEQEAPQSAEADPAAKEAPAEPGETQDAAAAKESETEEAAEKEKSEFEKISDAGALGFLKRGGFFMYPLLLLGIVAGGVFIERYRSLQLLRTDSGELRHEVYSLLHDDKVEEAHRLCESEQGPVPAILSAGLRKFLVLRRLGHDPARIEEQVVKAMDDYSVHIVAALERHLPILATISSVAPMLGFLGTVQGMIVSFDNINANFGEGNIVQLAAGGISVALLTTCFGLIIGIPSFMAFNYFTSVINRFVLDVEESAAELIEVVTLQMTLENSGGGESAPSDGSAAAQEVPVGYED